MHISKTSFGCYCTLRTRNGIYSTVCSAAIDELLYCTVLLRMVKKRDSARLGGTRFVAPMVLTKCNECATAPTHTTSTQYRIMGFIDASIVSSRVWIVPLVVVWNGSSVTRLLLGDFDCLKCPLCSRAAARPPDAYCRLSIRDIDNFIAAAAVCWSFFTIPFEWHITSFPTFKQASWPHLHEL